jgi:two-component system, sensor histidine kinase
VEPIIEVSAKASDRTGDLTPATLWAQASHDLRQPVQALLILTRTILFASDDVELRRAVEHMEKALDALQGKLELLTELSRLETPELRHCSLAELHNRVMAEMEAVAEQHGIGLRSRSPRGVVWSDSKLLVMVFRSLIMNAIRLGHGGDILVGWRRRGAHVRLELYFKAPPIGALQARSALIELRHRSDGKPTGALGLGLGFVAHLCRALGHGLEYTRLPANGQRIAVSLPLTATDASASRG